MAQRLPIDAYLLAYWGLDEANASDPGLDETGHTNLTITGSPAVVPARVGNGRQFDGVSTLAAATDSSVFLQWGKGTVICWIILDSVNQSGDGLRPIVTLEGAGATPNDDTALGLYVHSSGALLHRYTSISREVCERRTADGTIRTGRYYSVALVQDIVAEGQSGQGGAAHGVWVNNVPTPWASFTIAGVPQADPNAPGPAPAGTGANVQLRVGGSLKTASRWHGVIDELSIHKLARPWNPYLRAAYFRLTLAASFQQLTSLGNIRTLGTAEMGGGSRWWCYERDGSLYVIRENSLGLFSAEIQLVTAGTNPVSGAPIPAGTERPRLAYDASTDTLLVVFIAGGRVYKITASSQDAPVTDNMPGTADTAGIVKCVDFNEPQRIGAGEGGTQDGVGSAPTSLGDYPATVAFVALPSFGLAVYTASPSPYGYDVFQRVGGRVTRIAQIPTGTPYQSARVAAAGLYWFAPIAPRVYGAGYFAVARRRDGSLGTAISNIVIDYLGLVWTADALGDAPKRGTTGDYQETDPMGGGGAAAEDSCLQTLGLVTRSPVKYAAPADPLDASAGDSGYPFNFGFIARTPVKQSVGDSISPSAGQGIGVSMRKSNGARYDP